MTFSLESLHKTFGHKEIVILSALGPSALEIFWKFSLILDKAKFSTGLTHLSNLAFLEVADLRSSEFYIIKVTVYYEEWI